MKNKITIAIDARPLAQPLSGIGYYTQSMITALSQSDYKLLLFSPTKTLNITQHANIEIIHCKPLFRPTVLWHQLIFPLYLRKHKPDIFWSPRHHLPYFIPKKIQTILTIHDLVWKTVPKTMKRSNFLLEKYLVPYSVKKAKHIIADSMSTKNDLIKYLNTAKDKISIVYLAEVKRALSKTKVSNKINTPYLLSISTQEPRKNYLRLIKAYNMLPKPLKAIYKLYIIGGSGWGSENLQEEINALNLADNIILMGYCTDEKIECMLNAATALIFPSLYEGFGLPILEAMSHQVPVITSNNSSMQEIAKDAALLVDPYSTESIAKSLETLLEDPELRNKLKEKGKTRAAQFSWEQSKNAFINIIQQLTFD